MDLCNIRLVDVAEALGVTVNTVENKLQNGNWDLVEAYRLCKYLNLDLMKTIFAHPETVKILKKTDYIAKL